MREWTGGWTGGRYIHVWLSSVQWESQHAGLSCEQYQSWKRENDPEYQRQGLAGYLRDNGISKHTHTHISTTVFFVAAIVEGNVWLYFSSGCELF